MPILFCSESKPQNRDRGKKFWIYSAGNILIEEVSVSESNIQNIFFRADYFRYL